jgi:hypothetical protein
MSTIQPIANSAPTGALRHQRAVAREGARHEGSKARNRLVLMLADSHVRGVLRDGRITVEARIKGVSVRKASFEPQIAEELVSSGAARWSIAASGRLLALTESGKALARRIAAVGDGFLDQHRAVVHEARSTEGGNETVALNLKESPLLWLHRRKGKGSASLIDDAAFAAGERFRADFERAGLQARVTIDWSRLGASSDHRGRAEASDVILSAQARVHRALNAVGPDFAGVVVDLLCFDKGIEQLERERGWPSRSGKLVIRFALGALARHYGYSGVATGGANTRGIRLWHAPSASDDAGRLAPDPVDE